MSNNPVNITITTLNLNNLGSWSAPEKIEGFVEAIHNDLHNPDIIAVQEIGGVSDNTGSTVYAEVADIIIKLLIARFNTHYHYIDIPPSPNETGGAEGMNIRCGFFYKESIECLSIVAIGRNNVAFNGNTDRFVKSRFPVHAVFRYNQKILHVINCHLKSMSKKGQSKRAVKMQRIQQAEAILNYYLNTEALQTHPVIILGDFNDTPNSKPISLFEPTFHLPDTKEILNRYTYKYHGQPMVLDYIFYNQYLTLSRHLVIHLNTLLNDRAKFSDHDPVVAEFML